MKHVAENAIGEVRKLKTRLTEAIDPDIIYCAVQQFYAMLVQEEDDRLGEADAIERCIRCVREPKRESDGAAKFGSKCSRYLCKNACLRL